MRENRFVFLLLALVALIFVAPFLIPYEFGTWFINFMAIAVTFFIVYTMIEKRHFFIAAVLFALIILVMDINYLINDTMPSKLIYYSLILAFYAFAITELLINMFRTKEINANIIFSALCAYLLIGVFYSSAYIIIETIAPGSFQYQSNQNQLLTSFDLTYFSFTTLSTVGFGEIIPVTAQAKSIVILEEMTGVLYLAVIVAKMVAAFRIKH